MHGHHKKPHYRAKSPSPKVSPFSEPRLEPSLASQLLIRVVTLLFFHSGAIYHVHREHGDLTRNLSTNTATADNSKHTSDPKTLSFTRNDPLRTSVPSRGWGARSENDQTRDRWLDFRRMQVASDQITFVVESPDDITQDSEVFVLVRIVLDSVSLTRSNIQ